MIFTIYHSLDKERLWQLFTSDDFICKWLASESKINWKKNGRVKLTIEPKAHEIRGCKILEFEPSSKLVMNWKGPENFDITMNFDDYLTQVTFAFSDNSLIINHEGWRSSEDWQEAKDWHEKVFWPPKIAILSNLLQKN